MEDNNFKIDNPLISVVMPVYNEEKFISIALKSILEQTEKNFELIIIDDASTDNTVSIIEAQNDYRIRLIVNSENKGLIYNLNLGISLARGVYIARMDGDDICSLKRFEKQVRYLQKHTELDLISCWTYFFGDFKTMWMFPENYEMLSAMLLFNSVLAHPGFMLRRSFVEKNQLVYDGAYRSAEDYDFTVRVAERGKIGIVPKVLLAHRTHKSQITTKNQDEQKESANRIRLKQLKRMGIILNELEWKAYQHYALLGTIESIQEVYIVNGIIKKMIKQNEKYGIYLPKTFCKVLYMQFADWSLNNVTIRNPFIFPNYLKIWLKIIFRCIQKARKKMMFIIWYKYKSRLSEYDLFED